MPLVSVRSVPLRALTLSMFALTSAVLSAVFWPQALLDQQLLASVLALIPAFLLAYYRGWARVSRLLGVGMVTFALLHILAMALGKPFGTFPLVLLLVAPYVAIALGAGWFGEVRRSAATLRLMQLQLIQSEKLESMGRMAAGIAHEVKNPLMTLLTGVRVLSRRLPSSDDATRRVLADMTDAVSRADTIVSALLSYSRQQELELALADLNDVIEHSLLLMKHELATKHIRVIRELDRTLPPVSLDEFKIQQVFIDVMTNALHAMSDEGTLTLRTFGRTLGRPGDRVAVVQIDDTGTGIPPHVLTKVFDPFFTTKPTGHGTGLGLSVSRQIVEMHGGEIDIANREAGGARVTLTFRADAKEPSDENLARIAG